MSDTEETPELHADLSDVLRLVAELDTVATMGRRGRKILQALARAAKDVPEMTGLVVNGVAHIAYIRRQYAPCGCKDGRHRFTRDAPWFGRTGWLDAREDAEARKDRVRGHVVTRLVAETHMEVLP